MSTMILVRHGENDWVKKNRLAGWIEGVHLNENGRAQAAAAASRVSHLPIKAIYSSPSPDVWKRPCPLPPLTN
ncbi:MAG: hypothetical protein HC804_07240 [Anaerolineae bacterium]|nr:hypothetical protein [Anaerolineae bacterium]